MDGLKDPYCWEKAYADSIEPLMSVLLPTIISRVNVLVQTGHRIINEDEKSQLALIMVMQLLRGKQSRAYEKKLFDELLPSTIEKAMLSVGRNIEKLMLCGGVIHMETEQSESDHARINCLPMSKVFSKKIAVSLFISEK